MKKYNILLLLIIVLGLSSCYKDESAVNYRMINPIRIELGEAATSYRIFALDTLEIKPIVFKEGVPDENIAYSWEISGNLILPTILDSTMTLKQEITAPPHSNAYRLLYKITDKTTGIFVEQVYEITVQSPFGQGLIVCDSKDGKQSDMSLIMGRCFNSRVVEGQDTVMRNLFSRVNMRKIDGIITSAVSTTYQDFRTLTIATSNSIERVDPFDYSYMDRDGQIFYIDPKVYNVSCLANDANSGYDFMINDGKMYSRTFQQYNRLYTYYLLASDLKDYRISKIAKPYWNLALGFDELNGRFLEVHYSAKNLQTLERTDNNENPFKSTQLKGFTCLNMFPGRGATSIHAILENKETKRKYSYQTKNYAWYDENAKLNGAPLAIVDFAPEKCPDIENAVAFAATESSQDIIYYATKTKVYSVSFTVLNSLIVREEYVANEGEEITNIDAWTNYRATGSIYVTNPDPNAEMKKKPIVTKNNMIVVSTFSDSKSEGFIYGVGVAVTGTGKLEQDKKLHSKFGGFGKISYFTFQYVK